jgi:ABC-type nickel/cobalt efflux system permease component RcnA
MFFKIFVMAVIIGLSLTVTSIVFAQQSMKNIINFIFKADTNS